MRHPVGYFTRTFLQEYFWKKSQFQNKTDFVYFTEIRDSVRISMKSKSNHEQEKGCAMCIKLKCCGVVTKKVQRKSNVWIYKTPKILCRALLNSFLNFKS